MPRGDGTGPGGAGPGTRRGSGSGLGAGGFCVCIKCGEKISHQMGVPCFETQCPKCGGAMRREAGGSR